MASQVIPTLFEELYEELESPGSTGSSLASDAHGLFETETFADIGTASPSLSKEEVIREVDDLEYYEQVSLAFLLCDEVNYILERLMTAERARTAGSLIPVPILSEWLQCQRHGIWENKIVEALCIIQNYQVLEHLGYDIDCIKARFLPRSPESSLFICCMRKALYHMCENLSVARLKELLRRATNDYAYLHKGETLEIFDVEFMEINILYWSFLGYINLGDGNGRGVDIHKLKSILKGMEETTMLDSLESSERARVNASVGYGGMMSSTESMSSQSSSMGSLSTRSEPSISSQHSVASATSVARQPQPLKTYNVDPNHVGYCIIINQKNFYRDPREDFQKLLAEEKLDSRLGTDMDRERLIDTFESMGFTTRTAENLTHEQILEFVDKIISYDFQKEHSCLVLCIMSHGVQGMVYGSNSVPVSEEQLQEIMISNLKLVGKPKILIIQACQGKAHQEVMPHEDVALDGPRSRGGSSDFMTFWSTVPGYASFRHEIDGAWFIQTLSRHLLSGRSTDDVCSLFTAVNADVSKQRALINGSYRTMVPVFKVTLTEMLILPHHPERRLSVSLRMAQRHLFIFLLWEYIESRKKKVEKKRMKYY